MKFTTHHYNDDIDNNGTHLHGYISITFADLVAKLGPPTDADAYKIDYEWIIKFDDGKKTVATIYNWKNGKNYCGDGGMDVKDITEWHIGGHTIDAIKCVKKLFPNHKIETLRDTMTFLRKSLAVAIMIGFIVSSAVIYGVRTITTSSDPVSCEEFNEK
jgi:hypothetical protein